MRSAAAFFTVPMGEDYLLEQFLERPGFFTPRNSLTHTFFCMFTMFLINKQKEKNKKTKNTIYFLIACIS